MEIQEPEDLIWQLLSVLGKCGLAPAVASDNGFSEEQLQYYCKNSELN